MLWKPHFSHISFLYDADYYHFGGFDVVLLIFGVDDSVSDDWF